MNRKDYMTQYSATDRAGQRELHRAYYAQFVTPAMSAALEPHLAALLASKDEHLNDVYTLAWWDRISRVAGTAQTRAAMKARGDYPTLAGHVCIVKEAARQLIDAHNASNTNNQENTR